MNTKALWDLTYGVYVIGANRADKLNAQIANTLFQITSEPPVVAVSIYELWENGQVSEVGAFGVMLSVGLMLLSVIFHKFIKTRGVERSDQTSVRVVKIK